MTGIELKKILARTGKTQAEIAALMNMSRQNFSSILSAADVRTGTIEKLCEVLGLHPSFFYGGGATATNNSVAVNGSENNVSVDASLVSIIDRQSKQITDLINILSKASSYVQ